ncbi:MAG: mobile mystery protein A [Ferrovibrio sp.]|nr:mobile mystery protein A [Ferrovibrio sp.]
MGKAAATAQTLPKPPEGWLRSMRKALGLSGAQLARRMGVTRARIAKAEQAEKLGGITLKSMQDAADAMGCRFVYAIVPANGSSEDLILVQARKKARAIVGTASGHMALENQALPTERITREIERLAQQLAREMPPGFWDDP